MSSSTPHGTTSSPPIGTCPRVRVKCEVEERNECTRHRQCPKKKRCCLFSCGKKCMDLNQGTSLVPDSPALLPSHCSAPLLSD